LIDFYNANNTTTIARINVRTDGAANSGSYRISTASAGTLNEVIRIDSSGRVGIGSTAPSTKLEIREDSAGSVVSLLKLNNNAAIASGKGVKIEFGLSDNSAATARGYIENVLDGSNGTYMAFGVNDGATGTFEAIRIDRNRRLLVGTSTPRRIGGGFGRDTGIAYTEVAGTGNGVVYSAVLNRGDDQGPSLAFAKTRGGSVGSTTIVQSGDVLGELLFAGGDGTDIETLGARISAQVDGTPGANDMPGRLVLSTTADGASSPTERMRIDSSGRLGLGTSSPAELLHVSGGNIRFGSTGFIGEDVSGSPVLISIGVNPGSTYTVTRDIQFLANPNNASSSVLMTIKGQTGRVGIGTTTPSSTLHVYESSGNNKLELQSASLANTEQASFSATGGARSQAYGIYKHSGITNPCGYVGLTCEDAAQNFLWADNSDQLRISTNAGHIGTTSGTVIGTQTSDERVKNILGPVEYGLEILKQIEPVRYSLKSQPDIEQLGFIAQQVQPLVPQSVFDTKEHIEGEPEDAPTKLGMEYVALIPVLVNAIKELSAEVDALKAQLQAS
jgi:hypothetical protein